MASAIIERTGKADSFEHYLENSLSGLHRRDEPSLSTSIRELAPYFHLLLLFPLDVFRNGYSVILARRAIFTDLTASQSPDSFSFSSLKTRTVCRLFVCRLLPDLKPSLADHVRAMTCTGHITDAICRLEAGEL